MNFKCEKRLQNEVSAMNGQQKARECKHRRVINGY
jgi:hypothetical protein